MYGVNYEVVNVNAGEAYSKTFEAKKGQRLIYEFSSNRDLELNVSKGRYKR